MTKPFMTLAAFNKLTGAYQELVDESGIEPSEVNAFLIGEMNRMYDLPVSDTPSLANLGESPLQRMGKFLQTLQDEINEGQLIVIAMQILKQFNVGERKALPTEEELRSLIGLIPGVSKKQVTNFVDAFYEYGTRSEFEIEENLEKLILVSLADWLNDMNVFNASEGAKYGIPMDAVFKIIMASNFTKLGADGEILKDGNGKFLKGPNYVAPEQHIEALLYHSQDLLAEYHEQRTAIEAIGESAVPLLVSEVVPSGVGDCEAEEDDGEDEEDDGTADAE